MAGDLKSHIGVRVKQARRRRKLTQAEIAEKLGKSVETISNIERGASWTSLQLLEAIAEELEESLGYFFQGFAELGPKPRSKQILEAEISDGLRMLNEKEMKIVRDLLRSLISSKGEVS